MKYSSTKSIAITLLFVFNSYCMQNNFEQQWNDMQAEYKKLCEVLDNEKIRNLEKEYCGPYWQEQKMKFRKVLFGEPKRNLWTEHFIQSSMVRTEITKWQDFEACYIKLCVSEKTKSRILSYEDTNFNLFPMHTELKCSPNTLGHLFYAAKVLEKADQNNVKLNTIFEFGGGYGNLARILKYLNPQATMILIDLPEFLSLQYLFLKSTLPYEVIMHKEAPKSFKEGAINLVPVFLLNDINVNADLFISTFAISEAPEKVQSIVADKKFFNADIIYLAGQLNSWIPSLGFEHHSFIHSQVRNLYTNVDCIPFHGNLQLGKTFESYEMIAINKKK